MRFLVVEDDFTSRRVLQMQLQKFVTTDVVIDGAEAIEAFRLSWEEADPYAVVFLDIMMPNIDGHEALKEIRTIEKQMGVHDLEKTKVIMTTALEDPRNVVEAYYEGGADAYLVKPIIRESLMKTLENVGFTFRLDR